MKRFLLFVVVVQSMALSAQKPGKLTKRKDSVGALKQVILDEHILSSQNVGFAGSPSQVWYASVLLLNLSTTGELLQLTKAGSPYLRVYGYWGLHYLKYIHLDGVKKRLLADTTAVETMSGCILGKTTVNQVIGQTDTWYASTAIDAVLKAINADSSYRSTLFDALVHNKPVGRYPGD